MIFNRPDEQVFASTAKSGEVVDFPDILRGWGLTFDQTGGIPPMEWFNALGLRTDQAIQYFLQHGIAEWGESTDYVEGAYTKHNNKVWRSKKRNSGNEPTALNDNWEQAALTLEEVKGLIPQLMTKEELEEGVSKIPRTINAELLKLVGTPLITRLEIEEGTSTEPRTINAVLIKEITSKGEYVFHNISVNTLLTEDQAGVILIDASAGDITVTLPSTENNIGFILRRIDNTVHKVRVQISGTGKIKYNAAINANGYSFFNLFGAGDYWRVVSDGLGNWFDIERKDNNPIGGMTFISSTLAPSGGHVVANGALLSRTDYPYLWDYAQKSGALVAESEITGNEGCFTSGDGATTFRLPDLRGKFLRALDNGLGLDANRVAGSYQKDAIQNITGTITNGAAVDATSGVFTNNGAGRAGTTTFSGGGREIIFDASRMVRTADEVRVKNIAYPVYIKII